MSSIPAEGSGELSEGKLTGDNWYPLNMARGSRTVYLGKRNKGLSSTLQPPEEGRRVRQPKHCYKHEDNSPKNEHDILSQKYRQIYIYIYIYLFIINYGISN